MYSAIQDEVNKINDPIEDTDNPTLELEEIYSALQQVQIDLEDLDTTMDYDNMTDDSFDKLKDLVLNGNDLVDAYRNVLPVKVLQDTKDTITAYKDELIGNILDSDNANEYRAGLDFIIANLSTIYKGEELSLKELKEKFDNKYN